MARILALALPVSMTGCHDRQDFEVNVRNETGSSYAITVSILGEDREYFREVAVVDARSYVELDRARFLPRQNEEITYRAVAGDFVDEQMYRAADDGSSFDPIEWHIVLHEGHMSSAFAVS